MFLSMFFIAYFKTRKNVYPIDSLYISHEKTFEEILGFPTSDYKTDADRIKKKKKKKRKEIFPIFFFFSHFFRSPFCFVSFDFLIPRFPVVFPLLYFFASSVSLLGQTASSEICRSSLPARLLVCPFINTKAYAFGHLAT